jgi:hypothetical protein
VLAALWSPPAINLYLVIQATGVAWSSLLLPGIILSLIGFALSFWMETRKGGLLYYLKASNDFVTSQTQRAFSREDTAVLHVVISALLIMGIVFALEKFKIGQTYTRIMLAGIIVGITWSVLRYLIRPGSEWLYENIGMTEFSKCVIWVHFSLRWEYFPVL